MTRDAAINARFLAAGERLGPIVAELQGHSGVRDLATLGQIEAAADTILSDLRRDLDTLLSAWPRPDRRRYGRLVDQGLSAATAKLRAALSAARKRVEDIQSTDAALDDAITAALN